MLHDKDGFFLESNRIVDLKERVARWCSIRPRRTPARRSWTPSRPSGVGPHHPGPAGRVRQPAQPPAHRPPAAACHKRRGGPALPAGLSHAGRQRHPPALRGPGRPRQV
eukprot:scaffold159297_cov24-Prasinocladus_malaysianus.AAC.1